MQTRSERTPTQFYMPNTKTEIAISGTLAELLESSKFRSAPAIRKKPLKFGHARKIYKDLGDLSAFTFKATASSIFDCSKDPDVKLAADLLTELSSSASSSSAAPVWSDEMYPCFQRFEPAVVRLKLQGVPEICVS